MVWTKHKPILDKAWYWWRPEGGTNEDAKCIFVDFQSSDFQMAKGEWSHRPISCPTERSFETTNPGPSSIPKG